MTFSVEVAEGADLRRWLEESQRRGTNGARLAQLVVDKELSRLWHIERCRPKPGRVKTDTNPALLEMVELLDDIYRKLHRLYGAEDYKRLFGEQERYWKGLVAANDEGAAAALEEFCAEQPWTKRGT